jgi:Polysaccharide deacetylase
MPLDLCHPTAPHEKLKLPEWYVSSLMMDRALDAICRRVKKFDRKHDIPYLAGYSLDGRTIYIDRHMPVSFKFKGRTINTDRFLVLHEEVEKTLIDQLGLHYLHTFFEIGEHAIWHPEIAKQVAAAGNTIGSHTWSHKDLAKNPYARDIEQAKQEIEMIVPLAAGSSNAPRRIQPACIAMHHARIERRLAEPTHIAAHDRLEIQALPHQPNDKPRDVVLGHEVPHIRRQKRRLIDIPGAKVLAHSPSLNHGLLVLLNQKKCDERRSANI